MLPLTPNAMDFAWSGFGIDWIPSCHVVTALKILQIRVGRFAQLNYQHYKNAVVAVSDYLKEK